MKAMRLLVAGAVGAGKSTFVQTVNKMEAVSIDRIATDEAALLKQTTTVAFDFSCVALTPEITLRVYGIPGQYRFNFMWEILLQQAQLCLLLVAAHRPADLEQTRQILSFMSQRSQVPLLIGVTHLDCLETLAPQEIIVALGYEMSQHPPILTVDPHNQVSVHRALAAAANLLISRT
jgi:signal recognition particle receptor subunit beta